MPFIGTWDVTNLIYAVCPNALKLGSNPAAFNTGNFPVYQGESAPSKITAGLKNMLSGYGYTTDGLLKFDGVNDFVQPSYKTPLTNASKFTIEAWVYWTSGRKYVYSEGTNSANFFYIDIEPGGNVYVRFYTGSANDVVTSVFTTATAYNHIALVKDGASLKVFINGSEATYSTQNTYSHGNYTHSLSAINALSRGTTGSYSDENIKQLNVYDDAISPARILANYNAGITNRDILGSDNGDDTMRLYLPSTGVTHQSHTAIHTGIAIM